MKDVNQQFNKVNQQIDSLGSFMQQMNNQIMTQLHDIENQLTELTAMENCSYKDIKKVK